MSFSTASLRVLKEFAIRGLPEGFLYWTLRLLVEAGGVCNVSQIASVIGNMNSTVINPDHISISVISHELTRELVQFESNPSVFYLVDPQNNLSIIAKAFAELGDELFPVPLPDSLDIVRGKKVQIRDLFDAFDHSKYPVVLTSVAQFLDTYKVDPTGRIWLKVDVFARDRYMVVRGNNWELVLNFQRNAREADVNRIHRIATERRRDELFISSSRIMPAVVSMDYSPSAVNSAITYSVALVSFDCMLRALGFVQSVRTRPQSYLALWMLFRLLELSDPETKSSVFVASQFRREVERVSSPITEAESK